MRAVIVTLIIFGAVPWMLYYPFTGLMFWVGLGYLNPHRLAYGFARDLPFVQVAAIATMIAWIFSKEPKKFPANGVTIDLAPVHVLGRASPRCSRSIPMPRDPSWCGS